MTTVSHLSYNTIMTSLKETLSLFPEITLASKADNTNILKFFHSQGMSEGSSSIIYERGPDFFKFLDQRSDNYLVFIIKDKNTIKGLCSISYRKGYYNHIEETIGYLGDLRIQSSLKYTRLWRKFANIFFFESHLYKETNYCLHYYTVLMDTNNQSQNNFTKNSLGQIKFTPLANYKMLNYLGKFSIKPKSIIVENCHFDEFSNFYSNDQKQRYFGHSSDEIKRRYATWDNFDDKNLLCVKEKGEIIATGTFWNPKLSKTIKLKNIPLYIKYIYSGLSALTHLNLPKENKTLEIIYLNQLSFNSRLSHQKKSEILKAFINHIEKLYKFNMISYCDFEIDNLSIGVKCDIHQTMNMKYYYVHHESRIIASSLEESPGFEMALV